MLKIIDYFVSWMQKQDDILTGWTVYCSTHHRAKEVSDIAQNIQTSYNHTITNKRPIFENVDASEYFTFWEFMENRYL